MIPAGYMAKRVSVRPQHLDAERVTDVYSVSSCISKNFADYVGFWKHNGYWFFDSPRVILQLAQDHSLDLHGTSLFYYEAHARQFDDTDGRWSAFQADPAFTTHVVAPHTKMLEGYDVVTFSMGTNPECSPLSCNYLAREVGTNEHCLLATLDEARQLLEHGAFKNTEPGPFRIFAVYTAPWPLP